MRFSPLFLSLLLFPMVACAHTPRVGLQVVPYTNIRSESYPLTSIQNSDIRSEARRLQLSFELAIPPHVRIVLNNRQSQNFIQMAKAQLANSGRRIDHPQFVLVIDRSIRVQEVVVVLAQPDGEWNILGATHVSTGKPGRKDHYKTPVGVFFNSSEILGYRAQGTYNQNHIRGLGLKGYRVWDFGWQRTEDWKNPGNTHEIRLEMHATDPANLEFRIGRPDSEGCIRIPAAMNQWLDINGIIDAQDEAAAQRGNRRFESLLRSDRTPTSLSGDMVIVVDSSQEYR
jgi:hypothetical protein